MRIKIFIMIIAASSILPGCKDDKSFDSVIIRQKAETAAAIPMGDFKKDNYGYIICEPETGTMVKFHNNKKTFIPASVTKLFAALFILKNIDSGHRFHTTLSHTGEIENGVITGDLFIHGGGDPELGMRNLISLVRRLKEEGIRSVRGKFIYDDSWYNGREMLDKTMPVNAYYNPGIGPLSLNSNRIYATGKKSRNNGKLFLTPSVQSDRIETYDGEPMTPAVQFKKSGQTEIWMVPSKKFSLNKQPLPVKNPSLYTAWSFHRLCGNEGIKLPAPESGHISGSESVLADHQSRPAVELVRKMLISSNNLYAEMLTLAAVKEKTGSTTKADEKFMNFFRQNFTGADWSKFRIVNFSGLSSSNRITPEQTAAVLVYLYRNGINGKPVEDFLPMAGWDGTLRNRLDSPECAFKVFAKTGSIFYSSGLAGVLRSAAGKKYIFSVFVTDRNKRKSFDSIKEKQKEDTSSGARWTRASQRAIDKFISNSLKHAFKE